MKPPIPRDRQEDVLHMLWQLLGSLESRVDGEPGGGGHSMDVDLVTAGFNVLNQIGYSDARPRWETDKRPTP